MRRKKQNMCLAIPSKVIHIDNLIALIDVHGARREVSLLLMPEEVSVGDYVLVHAGYAIQKVDTEAAEDAMNLIREALLKEEEQGSRNQG